MSISDRIKSIRVRKGYSQEYMAYKLGVSQATYSRIEKNDKMINFKNVHLIASAFEMQIVEIIRLN